MFVLTMAAFLPAKIPSIPFYDIDDFLCLHLSKLSKYYILFSENVVVLNSPYFKSIIFQVTLPDAQQKPRPGTRKPFSGRP